MSNWTQSICERCWNKQNPGRIPVRMKNADEEECCFCKRVTTDGIYIRVNPKDLEIHLGCYCEDCGKAMTEKEYSAGECFACGGYVTGEEDLA